MDKVINFDGTTLKLSFEKDAVMVTVAQSQVNATQAKLEASLLPQMQMLTGTVSVSDDTVQWRYPLQPGLHLIDDLLPQLSRIDQLELLESMLRLTALNGARSTVLIHPNNILFDENYNPWLIHRGIRGAVPPQETTTAQLLNQYKAFVIYVMTKQRDFDQMAQGDMNRVKSNAFNDALLNAEDFSTIKQLLDETLALERERTRTTEDVVPKRKYRFYHLGFYVTLVSTIVLIGVVGYCVGIKVPFDNRMQASQTDYLSADYDAVINDLKNDQPGRLPKAGQYILATAYINTEGLSTTQKKNVLKNVSLKTDQNYLKFWIYNGRGDFKESLSLAQYIGDNQLLLYTYTKLYEDANTNTKLSGNEKQTLLSKYQKKINAYKTKLGGSDDGLSK